MSQISTVKCQQFHATISPLISQAEVCGQRLSDEFFMKQLLMVIYFICPLRISLNNTIQTPRPKQNIFKNNVAIYYRASGSLEIFGSEKYFLVRENPREILEARENPRSEKDNPRIRGKNLRVRRKMP